MRVLVFDGTRGGGHSFNYHRLLLPALAALTDELTVVVGAEVLDLPSTQIQIRDLPPSIRWEASVPSTYESHMRRQLVLRRALLDAIKLHEPEHLYVPTADNISLALGVAAALGRRDFPPGMESECVLHRCGFAYPAASWRKNLFYQTGFRAHRRAPWTRFLSVDLLAYEWIQEHGGSLAQRNEFLPDPVEDWQQIDRHEARQRLELADDGLWLGCVGTIDERKGIAPLLAAFHAATLPPATRLLLAGEQSPYVRELLATKYADLVDSGRVVSFDRYLSVSELGDAMASLDLVCTPYPRQIAIASIVLRAAAARRPVLATDFGWCGRIVPAFQLGWTTNVLDTAQFAAAITRCIDQLPDWQPSAASERLVEFHSPENFAATFTARLRERLGLPPQLQTIAWKDVAQFSAAR